MPRALPLADDAVDAALAVLTVHHWQDLEAGVAELRRVARRRVVVLTFDPDLTRDYWLLRELDAGYRVLVTDLVPPPS